MELFFKALKQNLRIKTFVGTSPNALQIQIWTALIALLRLAEYVNLGLQTSKEERFNRVLNYGIGFIAPAP